MRLEEPSFEEVAAFTAEHVGLDAGRDRSDLAKLATIGLTLRAWRNTSLEDLHAGSHASGGFSDAQMMRFNIATFRVVGEYVEHERFDWSGLRTPSPIPIGCCPEERPSGRYAGMSSSAWPSTPTRR